MAGKLRLLECSQTADGQALGTFVYEREGMISQQFQQLIPGDAGQADIGKILFGRVAQILAAEPVPAVALVKSMFAGGPRAVANPVPAPEQSPAQEQPAA